MISNYNYNTLENYSKKYNVELLEDYFDKKISRKFIIKFKCINTNCNENTEKKFMYIIENGGFYCKKCTRENTKEKIKQTNLNKYGVENPFQSPEIKEKIKQTNIEKYGAENPFQSPEIKKKIKQTNIEKYGAENPFQSLEIKEKIKQRNLINYGVEYILQNDTFKQKFKNIILQKYGVNNLSQNEDIKKKKKETTLKNYGVEYPAQNLEIMEKCSKNAYKLKNYILPSGKNIRIQGYENYALDELLISQKIDENDILTGVKNVPTIWYNDINNKKHIHYVDIFIISQNKCVEVKSTWTAKKKKDNIFLKQQAGKELGYKYELWIYNKKGERVEFYD